MKPRKYILTNDFDHEYKMCENNGDFSLEYLLNDYVYEFIYRYKLNSICQYTIDLIHKDEKEVSKIMKTTDHHTIIFTIKENIEPSKWDIYKI